MLETYGNRLRTAVGALALGGFLIVWLTVWPFWLVRSHYLAATSSSSRSHG